jgi:transcription factor WhiB
VTVDHREMKRQRAAALVESWQLRLEVAKERPGWQRHAACLGSTELMYPERADEEAVAIAVCVSCPVRMSCLGAARADELPSHGAGVYGVRGGLIATQRTAVYKRFGVLPGGPHPLIALVMQADVA